MLLIALIRKQMYSYISENNFLPSNQIIVPKVVVCVSSLSYPACKAHEPYYIVNRGLPDSTMFLTLPHKPKDFRGEKLLNMKCVL